VGVGVNGSEVGLGVGVDITGGCAGIREASAVVVEGGIVFVPDEHAERNAKTTTVTKPSSFWQLKPDIGLFLS